MSYISPLKVIAIFAVFLSSLNTSLSLPSSPTTIEPIPTPQSFSIFGIPIVIPSRNDFAPHRSYRAPPVQQRPTRRYALHETRNRQQQDIYFTSNRHQQRHCKDIPRPGCYPQYNQQPLDEVSRHSGSHNSKGIPRPNGALRPNGLSKPNGDDKPNGAPNLTGFLSQVGRTPKMPNGASLNEPPIDDVYSASLDSILYDKLLKEVGNEEDLPSVKEMKGEASWGILRKLFFGSNRWRPKKPGQMPDRNQQLGRQSHQQHRHDDYLYWRTPHLGPNYGRHFPPALRTENQVNAIHNDTPPTSFNTYAPESKSKLPPFDDLGVSHLAGPPYHDHIPDNVSLTLYDDPLDQFPADHGDDDFHSNLKVTQESNPKNSTKPSSSNNTSTPNSHINSSVQKRLPHRNPVFKHSYHKHFNTPVTKETKSKQGQGKRRLNKENILHNTLNVNKYKNKPLLKDSKPVIDMNDYEDESYYYNDDYDSQHSSHLINNHFNPKGYDYQDYEYPADAGSFGMRLQPKASRPQSKSKNKEAVLYRNDRLSVTKAKHNSLNVNLFPANDQHNKNNNNYDYYYYDEEEYVSNPKDEQKNVFDYYELEVPTKDEIFIRHNQRQVNAHHNQWRLPSSQPTSLPHSPHLAQHRRPKLPRLSFPRRPAPLDPRGLPRWYETHVKRQRGRPSFLRRLNPFALYNDRWR